MIHGIEYACIMVSTQTTSSIRKLCFTVKRNRSDSLPISPTAATPMAIDCGEIILPVTPPDALALTVTTGSTPMVSAAVACSLQNNAFEDVSEPVRNTPNQPSIGEKKGNNTPVPASATAIVMDIPELFATNAKPTTDAMVTMENFNCLSVLKKIRAPSRQVIPMSGMEISAANRIAVPGVERKLDSKGFISRAVPSRFRIASASPGISTLRYPVALSAAFTGANPHARIMMVITRKGAQAFSTAPVEYRSWVSMTCSGSSLKRQFEEGFQNRKRIIRHTTDIIPARTSGSIGPR